MWYDGSKMTKYCSDSDYGTVDNKTKLEAADDAATANWGSDWCMPTNDQQRELVNSSYTTTTWTTRNGVYGRYITSKMTGYTDKSLFLPAAGCRGGSSLGDAGSRGSYWSSELGYDDSDDAWVLSFYSRNINAGNSYNRCYGRSVRPVRTSAN